MVKGDGSWGFAALFAGVAIIGFVIYGMVLV